jgi:hypothetical protein
MERRERLAETPKFYGWPLYHAIIDCQEVRLRTLLDDGDFPAARYAWQQEFAGREGSLEASWELSVIEERWGDSFFFAAEPGAAAHFEAARAALIPPGTRFPSPEENDRRMEAHQRLTGKLYAIDPHGMPRHGHDARPHPDSCRTKPRTRAEPSPSRPSVAERREAALKIRQTTTIQQTDLARLFQNGDPWGYLDLGSQWRAAGDALTGSHPSSARRAYAWSLHYFELYNRAWTAHLPASRWDPDGGQEIGEIEDLTASLEDRTNDAPLPGWVESLLAGDWKGALSAAASEPPVPAFQALAGLLKNARVASEKLK